MAARKKGPDPQEVLSQVVQQLDQAVRRLEQALEKVDTIASDRIDQLDQTATNKITEVETSALKVVSESADNATRVVEGVRGSVEGVLKRASREGQAIVDRAQTAVWMAVGAFTFLAVFAFILFWVDRVEERTNYSPEGVLLFTTLIFIAFPVLLWVVSAGFRAIRNSRLPHADREQRFDGDLKFIDYMFGFFYSRERVNNIFGVLSLFGIALTIIVLILLYTRPVL